MRITLIIGSRSAVTCINEAGDARCLIFVPLDRWYYRILRETTMTEGGLMLNECDDIERLILFMLKISIINVLVILLKHI